jgi:hypothetical protein
VIAAVIALHLSLAAPVQPITPCNFPCFTVPSPVFSPPSFGFPSPRAVPPPQQRLGPAQSPRSVAPPPANPTTSQSSSQELKHLGTQVGGAVFIAGLVVMLVILLIMALVASRGAKKPDSRTRAILDAGIKAIPAVIVLLGGLMAMIIGVFYLMFLFVYLIVDFFVSIFVDAFTNKSLHLGGTEYGDLGWNTALYLGIGTLLMGIGIAWLAAIGTRGVVRFRQKKQELAAAQVYDMQPPPPPPPPMPAAEAPPPGPSPADPPAPRARRAPAAPKTKVPRKSKP